MANHGGEAAFLAKRWVLLAPLAILGGLMAFSLVLGPAFFFGAIRPADGADGRPAGIGLTVGGLGLLIPACLIGFQVVASREPILSLGPEGVTVRIIGRSSLATIPLVPLPVRLLWAFFSLQGFRVECIPVPWGSLRTVEVRRWGLGRVLAIAFDEVPEAIGQPGVDIFGAGEILLADSDLAASVDDVAVAILAFHRDHSPAAGRSAGRSPRDSG